MWRDALGAEAFGCHARTVANVRQRLVEAGLEGALARKKREVPPWQRKLDGAAEARLIALSCSQAPQGRAGWTLQLLADELVALGIVAAISGQTIRRTLKKNTLKPHLRKCWVIPPEQDAAFVANMEDVLEVYQRPYDPAIPQICMDEQPVQLIKETRVPLPGSPGKPTQYDYEYERNGTASIFMFSQPLAGWRRVSIRDGRTASDWAEEIRLLLEQDFPDVEKVALVCDNLNPHTTASLYKAFVPEKARSLVERLEMHFTPKNGSWLNMAEIELSVLTTQCLNRRIPDLSTLRQETTAWQLHRNTGNKSIDWQFRTANARIKLKRLYPQIKES